MRTVPWLGNPVELATGRDDASKATFAEMVLAAVSKAEALVNVNDVTESLMPPLSLSVVWV